MHGSVHRMKSVRARRIIPLCLCTVAGLALLCAALPAHAQSNDVLNRLKRMETEIDTLNRAVYKGEKPPASASGPDPAMGNIEVRLGQIESSLRDLTGKVEQQSYDNQQLQQQLEALSQDSKMRLDAIEAQLRGQGAAGISAAAPGAIAPPPTMEQPVDPATVPQAAPNEMPQSLEAPIPAEDQITGDEGGPAATDAAGLYEQGFGQIKAGDYAGAEKSFAAFMKEYPKHALAPNALYWLGETYYARKDYDKASRAFAEAYQKYPGGPKGADNLLKLGLSLAGKGEKQNACIALSQLSKEYPNGPQPVLARGVEEMSKLGCQ